jgi:hypothetical protein
VSRLVFASQGVFGREVSMDVACIRRGGTVVVWTQLDHYRHEWDDWTRPGQLVAVDRRGKAIRLAPHAERWTEVAAFFFREAHPRLRANPNLWPFTIRDDGLACRDRTLAWSELASVELAPIGRRIDLVVHARDGGEWFQLELRELASPWLLLELLVERGVVVHSPLTVPVPVAAVVDAIATASRLPVARVVRPTDR